jgi:hypothetical protein
MVLIGDMLALNNSNVPPEEPMLVSGTTPTGGTISDGIVQVWEVEGNYDYE